MKPLIRQVKLKPPDCSKLLPRRRLVGRVLDNLGDEKLVVLSAAPGYGKTVLMAQLMQHFPGFGIWYQFDGMDPNLRVFVEHITRGIRLEYHDFGRLTLNELQRIDDEEAWEPVLISFIHELTQFDGRMGLFLNDFHLAAGDAVFAEAIQFLLWNLPDDCTVFLGSWGKPGLSLGRMRVLRRLIEIGPEELQFEMGETAALVKGCCRPDLSDEEIAMWQRAAAGWPVALASARRELAAKRRAPEQIIPQLMQGSGAIRKFIDTEIWAHLEEKMQNFLLDIAIVPHADADVCEDVYRDAGRSAFQMLSEAEERQLLISCREGGHVYELHPLFHRYLVERSLQTRDSDERSRVHYRFARAYENHRQVEEAVEHYLKSGALEEAAALLVSNTDWSPVTEMPDWLSKWIDLFPREFALSEPWLGVLSARLCLCRGEFQESLAFAEAAADHFTKQDDARGLYQTAIVQNQAFTLLNRRSESLGAARKAMLHAGNLEERVYALNREATEYVFLGQPEKANSICSQAMSLCDDSVKAVRLFLDVTFLHTKYMFGNFRDLLDDTSKLLRRHDIMGIPAQYRFCLVYRRINALFQTGQYEEAFNLIRRAKDYVQAEVYQPLLEGLRGQVELCVGREESGRRRLEAVYQKSSQRFLSTDSALNYIGCSRRHRGAFDEALDYHTKSWFVGKLAGNYFAIASSLVNIGADKMYMAEMKGKDGEAELDVAHAMAHRHGYGLVDTQIHYFLALRAFKNGRYEVALTEIRISLERAAAQMHNHFILQEAGFDHDLLAFTLEHDIAAEYLTGIFAMAGRKSVNVLIPMLKSEYSNVRRTAVSAMGAAGDAAAIPPIRQLLFDPDAEVRKAAEDALTSIRSGITDPLEVLTLRESELLPLVGRGLTNEEIARRLHITEPTVKTHVTHIFRKLGLTNRSQATEFYDKENTPPNVETDNRTS